MSKYRKSKFENDETESRHSRRPGHDPLDQEASLRQPEQSQREEGDHLDGHEDALRVAARHREDEPVAEHQGRRRRDEGRRHAGAAQKRVGRRARP